jgi:hypothetical protein
LAQNSSNVQKNLPLFFKYLLKKYLNAYFSGQIIAWLSEAFENFLKVKIFGYSSIVKGFIRGGKKDVCSGFGLTPK